MSQGGYKKYPELGSRYSYPTYDPLVNSHSLEKSHRVRDLSASKAAHLEFGFGVLKVGGSGFRFHGFGLGVVGFAT